ncbi:hypothetical protein HMN09_00202700 [Mycena chlorophos]|uniref:Uncharacterized protein n=1 Tax=Mycena chlorophos TaxID=658473 RepID=A0A8H6TQW1_MYCCL|nr:hypothetical protein HMN09_00202700 [Mycena chlorophos]
MTVSGKKRADHAPWPAPKHDTLRAARRPTRHRLSMLARFATLVSATLFYLYMKIYTFISRRRRKETTPNDVEASIPCPEKAQLFVGETQAPFTQSYSPSPLGTITNTHGQGLDQARLRSPHNRRSIKRASASPNLRFESDISSPKEQQPRSLPVTPSPGSVGWHSEKEKVLGEARRWSAGVREKKGKRASLPASHPTKETSNSPWRASAPAILDSPRLPLQDRLQRACEAKPAIAERLSHTISEVVDVYANLPHFVVGNDTVDMTLIAVSDDGNTSLASDQTLPLPLDSTLKKQYIETNSELAYLRSSSSLKSCDTLPFTLPPSMDRCSDGTLGDVLDALEEMIGSPKWLSLVDLEGATARHEDPLYDMPLPVF